MEDKVKTRIKELCPDVQTRNTSVLIPAPFSGIINHRDETITLAVVLRAIDIAVEHHSEFFVSQNGNFKEWGRMTTVPCSWNLEHDNYDQQSEECKQFIGNLLGV